MTRTTADTNRLSSLIHGIAEQQAPAERWRTRAPDIKVARSAFTVIHATLIADMRCKLLYVYTQHHSTPRRLLLTNLLTPPLF